MKSEPKDSPYYKDWITLAKYDLNTAVILSKHGGFTNIICYHAQQTAEKILKAYILFKGAKRLPKTHVLPVLLSECEKLDESFSDLDEQTKSLDRYYIETKYPITPPVDYSKKEAEQAIDNAEELLNFVKAKLQ